MDNVLYCVFACKFRQLKSFSVSSESESPFKTLKLNALFYLGI